MYSTDIITIIVLNNKSMNKKYFAKFQSIAAAISFVYSSHLGLHLQMVILLVFGIIGTFCFCVVERSIKRKTRSASSLKTNEKLEIERRSE